MSPELNELLQHTSQLRRALSQVLSSQEAVDYIIELVAKDNSRRKLLSLTEEN